jgi:nitric oxide dioxygenase
MTSILNTLIAKSSTTNQKLHFIHGARNSKARAFQDHISSIAKDNSNIQATFFTSHPSADNKQGVDYHHAGRVDLSKLDANDELFLDNSQTQYYVCGPAEFMNGTKASLEALGVKSGNIKMELFGTGGL